MEGGQLGAIGRAERCARPSSVSLHEHVGCVPSDGIRLPRVNGWSGCGSGFGCERRGKDESHLEQLGHNCVKHPRRLAEGLRRAHGRQRVPWRGPTSTTHPISCIPSVPIGQSISQVLLQSDPDDSTQTRSSSPTLTTPKAAMLRTAGCGPMPPETPQRSGTNTA